MNPNAWSVFHDGEISLVSGSVPGNLEFVVEAGYLREQFPEVGSAFKISVIACDLFTVRSFESNEVVANLNVLSWQDREILSASLDGDILVITISGGQIRMRYQHEILALDTGRILQVSDVAAAADRALPDPGPE